jgi:hypothetical protein
MGTINLVQMVSGNGETGILGKAGQSLSFLSTLVNWGEDVEDPTEKAVEIT